MLIPAAQRPARWSSAGRWSAILVLSCLIDPVFADLAAPMVHQGTDPLADLLSQAHDQPRWFGAVLALWGLICEFVGWRIIRWSMALSCAAAGAGAMLAYGMPAWDPAMVWICAGAAAIVMGIVGFFLYQAVIALQSGALGAWLFGGLVFMIMPNSVLVIAVFGVLGGLLGLVIGWKLAAYVGILMAVLSGLCWAIGGLLILGRISSPHDALILAAVVAGVTVVPGIVVQVRDYRAGV